MTIAPIPAAPIALALALVSVHAPVILGVLAVLCVVAHVLTAIRDAGADTWLDVPHVASPVDAFADEVSSAIDCATADGPLVTYAVPVRPSPRPRSPSVGRTARLAFEAQLSARDAAIHCRVACTVGDRASATRWRDVAIGLASEASRIASDTQSPHAWRWHAGAVEAARDCSDRIATRWPSEGERASSHSRELLLHAAPVAPMLPPRSIRRGRGGRFVCASEAAS